MNKVQFTQILAIIDKMKIENSPFLTREEKELWKQFIDEIQKQVDNANRPTFY